MSQQTFNWIISALWFLLLVWTSPVVSQGDIRDNIPEELLQVSNLNKDLLDSVFRLFDGGNNFINGTEIPVYGRWCGPNYGSGTPVDAVDNACRTHDLCSVQRGYFDCRCDNQLVKNLGRVIKTTQNTKANIAGRAIRAFFQKVPCLCRRTVVCDTSCSTCTDLGGMAQWPCDCDSNTGSNRCPATIPTERNTRCVD